jgi:predicted DNA-binding transcriptional regulator AlpA
MEATRIRRHQVPETLPATDELVTAADLADELQIPEKTLAQWRYLGRGPKFLKLGAHVRYRRSDVDAWLAASEQGAIAG